MKNLNKKLLLSSPTMHKEEMEYINEAFEKNWVAPLGFNCDGFENEMEKYLGWGSAFAMVSGTSALHMSFILAGIKKDDIVFCSDLTFAASANSISYVGAKQVFIDSEKDSWNMDPDVLEEGFKRYPNAKAVVLVDLYGTPGKIEKIVEICKKHNAILIEDAAEALGSHINNKKCGTFGDYCVLSFNGNKIITTSGGGMIICKDKESRDRALFLSTQAREKAPWYEHNEIGYNYRMSNVVAGIGRGQLLHLEEHIARKKEIYFRYKEGLKDLPIKMNPYLEGTEPNYWLSCLTVNKEAMCEQVRTSTTTSWTKEDGKSCPDLIASHLLENNIETRPIWKPMHMQPVYKNNDFISKGVDEDIFERGICLPSDIKMTNEEQDFVIEKIKECF